MSLLPVRRWFSWPRLLCVALSAGLLWLAFRKIEPGALADVLQRANLPVLFLALCAYLLALHFGALVWHVGLVASGSGVHSAATRRFALIGHFFFVALFGAVGCDLGKSAVYSRWFRFGMPEVLAAAPLERGIRLIGASVVGIIVLSVAALAGGFSHLPEVRWQGAAMWVWISLLPLVLLAVLLYRHWRSSLVSRLRGSLRLGASQLWKRPGIFGTGLASALLAQVTASLVFVLCLAAVTESSWPWVRMAWTFPTVIFLSCLPFTVAGTGVREMLAITLLGIYGVPPAEALAASLLTLFQKLLLAAFGGLSWWREEALQRTGGQRSVVATISVVIPTLNEASVIEETIRHAQALPEVTEVIVVDGGSRDGTGELAKRLGCRVLNAPRGRGTQMRVGAQDAKGDIVLLLHSDTWLSPNSGKAILNCLRDSTVVGGGCWKKYRKTPLLLLGARPKCFLRILIARRVYGDQGLFVRREILEKAGGVPNVAIMEEFELCRRLRKIGRLALADTTVLASPRRFYQFGFLRTTWRTWYVSLLYRFGVPPRKLAQVYARDSDQERWSETPSGRDSVVAKQSPE